MEAKQAEDGAAAGWMVLRRARAASRAAVAEMAQMGTARLAAHNMMRGPPVGAYAEAGSTVSQFLVCLLPTRVHALLPVLLGPSKRPAPHALFCGRGLATGQAAGWPPRFGGLDFSVWHTLCTQHLPLLCSGLQQAELLASNAVGSSKSTQPEQLPQPLPQLEDSATLVPDCSLQQGASLPLHHLQQVIRLFRRWAILCVSASLNHRTMLVGMSILRGLRRWSRLCERCTPGQPAHDPRGPRCACFRAQAARLSAQWV